MKKLLCLVFVLIAVLGLTFAVSAAEAKNVASDDISCIYEANGAQRGDGKGLNGGEYSNQLYDGNLTKGCYLNGAGCYIILDLNKKLPGGYYVTDIAISHLGNSQYSVYYTNDGSTWNPVVENKQEKGTVTYAVNDYATQVKYVYVTAPSWTQALCEIQVFGIDPAEMSCAHPNLATQPWVEIPGSATCVDYGWQKQVCPDCDAEFTRHTEEVPALGHDLATTITKPGTSISYGEGTIECSRCDYAIDFKGEVDLTGDYYMDIFKSSKFVNVSVSSIADKWGASKIENMFNNTWSCGSYNGWFSDFTVSGYNDENEWVILDFKGELDLTKIDIMVPNDANAKLLIWAMNDATGEYEIVKELATYDESLGQMQNSDGIRMTIPMLGITTTSLKIQVISPSTWHDGFQYYAMIVGELHVYGIAPGCGLDADNHECTYDTFVKFVENQAATCKDAGYAIYKCACNAETTVEVQASEEYHNYVEVEGTRVDSTCTVAGSYTGKCEYCEAETTITLDFDTENGHNFTEEVSKKDADCENAGEIVYGCANCDATKTEEIKAIGHKFTETSRTNPDCENAGEIVFDCENCEATKTEEIKANGHTWNLVDTYTEPTCGEEGEGAYECTVCGDTKDDVIAPTGAHTWDEENVEITVNPSCTGTGAGKYTCTECGNTKSDVVPALGHDWVAVEGGVYVAPTCQKTGSEERRCSRCPEGGVQTVPVDPEAHNMEIVGSQDATCTVDGYINYKCTNRNADNKQCTHTSSEVISATGHDYVKSEVAEDGTYSYTCSVEECGNTYTVNNALLNGTYVFAENPTLANGSFVFADGVLTLTNDLGETAVFAYEYDVTNQVITTDWVRSIEIVDGELFVMKTQKLVAYVPPITFVVGENAIVTGADGVEVFFSVPGSYVLTLAEGEENAYVTLTDVDGDEIAFPYAFTVAEGETVMFCVATANQDDDTIDFVLTEGTLHVHDWIEGDYLPATCIQNGWINYTCSGCDETKTETTTNPDGHEPNYSIESEYVDPTCQEDGYYKFTCFYCESVVTQVLPASEDCHAWDWDNYVYVAPTCQDAGYEILVCLTCNKEQRTDYEPSEYAHVEDEEEIYGGYKYTCTLCGNVREEITKGTVSDPIVAVIGDNTFVYYIEDEEFVVYSFVVNTAGTVTITIDAAAGIYFGQNPYGWYYEGPQTGEATYTFEATEAGEYCILIALDTETYTLPETFNVAFTEKVYPTFSYGNNSVEIVEVGGSVEYVVTAPGNYVITFDEELVSLFIVYGPYYSEMVESGYAFTVLEGEKVKFAVGTADFEPATVELTVANPDNGMLNGKYVAPDGSAFFEFADGVLTVTDANPKLNTTGFAGTYNYNYNSVTGEIALDSDALLLSAANGTIYVFGRMPLAVYVPPMDVVLGDNEFTFVSENYYFGDKKVVFTASKGGMYVITSSETGLVLVEGMYGAEMVETPFYIYLQEGQAFEFIIATSANVMTETEDTVVINIAEHACVYDIEKSRTESTCTTKGSVTFACVCGDTKTEELKLADHKEEVIPAVPGELRNPGMTSGVKCSVCDTVIVAQVQASGDFRVGATALSLGENINIIYKIYVPQGYTNVYMVFEMTMLENGEEVVVRTVVEDYEIGTDGRYWFTFAGIRLQSMADSITATVYAENNGVVSANSYSNYSVKKYIVGQLEKSANSASLKTMLSDLLVLGAKTQVYTNYRANNLMTADVDASILTPSTYNGVPSSEFVQKMIVNDEATRAIADWKSVSLTFKDAMTLTFKLAIDPNELDNIKVVVTVPGVKGDDRIDVYTAEHFVYNAAENRYVLEVDNIKALQYGQTVYGDIYHNDVKISRTVNYSVNSYVQKNQDSANTALRDFLRAVYQYGLSAYAYGTGK